MFSVEWGEMKNCVWWVPYVRVLSSEEAQTCRFTHEHLLES